MYPRRNDEIYVGNGVCDVGGGGKRVGMVVGIGFLVSFSSLEISNKHVPQNLTVKERVPALGTGMH